MSVILHHGDALDVLATLPARSVQTVITSPPYFGLRDYGMAGQLGMEASVEDYVAALVRVFAAAHRALRDDGTLWLNLGDSYAGHGGYAGDQYPSNLASITRRNRGARDAGQRTKVGVGLKEKDLCGVPWRVAFALQAAGWYLRSDIIWHKPNPMPESVRDRPTRAHEYLFLLTKRARYYYDADAIREPHTTLGRPPGTKSRIFLDRDPQHHTGQKRRPGEEHSYHTGGRNKRDVWQLSATPYKGAHFATFPPALVEPCILAGSSPYACSACGAPYSRLTDRQFAPQHDVCPARNIRHGTGKGLDASNRRQGYPRGTTVVTTTGWAPGCACTAPPSPCVVLDPFCGSGTVGAVARRYGRSFVGIDLNADYLTLAQQRIAVAQEDVCAS